MKCVTCQCSAVQELVYLSFQGVKRLFNTTKDHQLVTFKEGKRYWLCKSCHKTARAALQNVSVHQLLLAHASAATLDSMLISPLLVLQRRGCLDFDGEFQVAVLSTIQSTQIPLQNPHLVLQRKQMAEHRAHASEVRHILCPTCPLMYRHGRNPLRFPGGQTGKTKPLLLANFRHPRALKAILQNAECTEPQKFKAIRVCRDCYFHLMPDEGGFGRFKFQGELIYQRTFEPGAKKKRASDLSLSLLTSAGRSRAKIGPPMTMFSERPASDQWEPASLETAQARFPLLRDPLPFANAEIADGYVDVPPDVKDFTASDLCLHIDTLLGANSIKCKGCSKVTQTVLRRQLTPTAQSTVTPEIVMACAQCGFTRIQRSIRAGATGTALSMARTEALRLATGRTGASANLEAAAAAGSSQVSRKTAQRAATFHSQQVFALSEQVMAERIAQLRTMLDEYGMNEPAPSGGTAGDAALRMTMTCPFYVALDGCYNARASNQAGWAAVSAFVVSTTTAVSTPLAVQIGTAVTADPKFTREEFQSEATAKGLEAVLVGRLIERLRAGGIRGLPLIVADQDAGVQKILSSFAWAVGVDKNHYMLGATREILNLGTKMTSVKAFGTDRLRSELIGEVREKLFESKTRINTESTAEEIQSHATTTASSPTGVDATAEFSSGRRTADNSSVLEQRAAADKAAWEALDLQESVARPLLLDLQHMSECGECLHGDLYVSAAAKHAKFSKSRQRPKATRTAPDTQYQKPSSIPPTIVVHYIKQRFVRNVYQAAHQAKGDPGALRGLLQISLQHYVGNHKDCHRLFPGGCKSTLTPFAEDSVYIHCLEALYNEFFGEVGQVVRGSVSLTVILHTNACESFNSQLHRYVEKRTSYRSRWFEGPLKRFLDLCCGESMWRELLLGATGVKLTNAQEKLYFTMEATRQYASERVKAGVDAQTKARSKSVKKDRALEAKHPDRYKGHSSSITNPELREDTLSQYDPSASISQQVIIDMAELASAPSAVLDNKASVANSGAGISACGPRRRALSSSAAPSPRQSKVARQDASSEEEDQSGTSENESEGSFQGETDSEPESTESMPGARLTYKEGVAQGWVNGNIRYMDDINGKSYFLREIFMGNCWQQFYFDALTGEMDKHEGVVQSTMALWPLPTDEEDTSKPDGNSVYSSPTPGFGAARDILESEVMDEIESQ